MLDLRCIQAHPAIHLGFADPTCSLADSNDRRVFSRVWGVAAAPPAATGLGEAGSRTSFTCAQQARFPPTALHQLLGCG